MKQRLLYAFILFFLHRTSSSQALVFADQFGGNDSQTAMSIAADHNENVFVAVVFYDDLDADPGPGETQLEAAGNADVALIKLTPSGQFEWVIHLGSDLFETARKVMTDNEGNVLICGYFKGTIDFDPGPSVHNLSPAGNEDGFLAKYDKDGNYLWAYRIGSSGYEEFYGADVDSAGNVYSLGYFQNTIDFDPGPGVNNLTAVGGNANFFWKLDKDGNFIWAKQIAYTFAEELLLDEEASVFVSGSFYGTVDFNPGSGTYNLTASGFGNDVFIMKLDKDGNFQWAGKMSGSSDESALCIGFTDNGKILLGGRFQGVVDFDPGNGTSNLTSTDYYDAFIECLNSDGTFAWVKSYGGAGWQDASSVAVDATGTIHLAGQFEQTADFDPSNNTYSLTSNGYTDGYHLALDDAGNFIAVFQVGGVLDDWLQQMVLDNEDGILTCGQFSWIVDFDPGVEENLLTSYTGWDGFAAKYCTSYTIENFVSICEGDSIFASGAWQTEPGDYYDYFDPSIGCDSTVITHLSFSHPVVDLGADTSICGTNTMLLDAGNWSSYLWSTGDTTQTIMVNSAGNYSVSITDASGCIGSDTISITQGIAPVVNLGPDAEFCEGTTMVLNAGNPGSHYLWSTGDTTKKITVVNGGTYSVAVSNNAGCTGYDTIVIIQNPLPLVDLGNDFAFCDGETVSLDAGNTGSEFLWSNGEVSQSILVTDGGTYSVKVTDANGCTASDTVVVTVHAWPVIDLGSDITLCEGDSAQLDAGNTGSEYLWNTGATSQTIYVSASALYAVTVTDNNNCTNADTVDVTVHPLPSVYLNAGDTTVCLSSSSMPLPKAFPSGGYYTGDGVSENDFNPGVAGLGDHTITYVYTDSFGCSSSDSMVITVVICTQTESLVDESIRVYPNPSDGFFVFERKAPAYEVISVTDVEGKELKQFTLHDEEKTMLDLHDLPAGIYFLVNDRKGIIGQIVLCDK